MGLPLDRRAFPSVASAHRIAKISVLMLGVAVMLAVLSGPVQSARAETAECTAPSAMLRLGKALPRVTQKIARGEALKIVALGSSSTVGLGATSVDASYPRQLELDLRRRYPKMAITVVNKGVNGQDTKEELLRFERDVLAEKPDLLVWQIGTNALLNRLDMAQVVLDLRDGVGKARAIGADVILMNPQFAPRVLEAANYQAMLDQLDGAGRDLNVGVFNRFGVMRSWTTEGRLAVDRFVTPDGLHMNDWGYGCVAKLVANAITQAGAGELAKQ